MFQIVFGSPFSSKFANFDTQDKVAATVSAGVTTSVTDCGNGWFRYSASVAATVTSSADQFWIYAVDSGTATWAPNSSTGGTMWLFGAQYETGAFATSFIASDSGTAVTRSADVCQITGTSFSSFFNANEGSIAAEYDTIYPLSLASSQRLFIFRDAGNSVRLNSEINTPGLYWETVPAGANIFGAYSASAYDVVKAGYGYKVNDFAITVNGSAASTDTSVSVPTGITLLDIGGMNGSQYLCGHIARLRYYPTRLPNATLQVLST
jgi:hypothetical protein